MSDKFDFNKALEALQSGQAMSGKDGVLAPLTKQLTEAALNTELETHLDDEYEPNRKNGRSQKTLETSTGNIRIDTPRDRSGTFEPQFIKKNQSSISTEIESKILFMYGHGMSYGDISEHVEEMYGINASSATLSAVTDKIIGEVKA